MSANKGEEQRKNRLPKPSELIEGEHYYMEGPYMVFTAKYHLLRGFCCGSGCRHCPYTGTEKRLNP